MRPSTGSGGATGSGRAGSGRSFGVLHTVPDLVPIFQRLIVDRDQSARVQHLADPQLLATAMSDGVTDDVAARVALHLQHLDRAGVDAILVTCSSIGEAAEAAAGSIDAIVVRVDSAMAAEAARIAGAGDARGRIAVLATLESTLGPTGRLVARSVRQAGPPVEVMTRIVEGAAAARALGDIEVHDQAIRDSVADISRDVDVVVLAQASMAVDGLTTVVPVLTSPDYGVADLLATAGGVRASHAQ